MELVSTQILIAETRRTTEKPGSDEIFVQDIKFMRDPDLGIRLYSPWFNNYHRNTRVENAAVLSIEGYFIKNREEQFIRRYRRIIYPDGEWKVFVNQDGTYTSQEITYTQTPEGLSRTIITHG